MPPNPSPMPSHPAVTVIVPTLSAGAPLSACLDSLARQSYRDVEIVVVDNSGRDAVEPRAGVRVIANQRNLGFGAAVNQAIRESAAPFVVALNDDATVDALRIAFAAVFSDPALSTVRERLLLDGIDLEPRESFSQVLALARDAAESGFPVLR